MYNCPSPTVTLDPFNPFGNVYLVLGAGGPVPFTWNATSNATWLEISSTSGSLSTTTQEQKIFLSIPDWSQVSPGSTLAQINFTAVAANQSDLIVPVMVEATNNLGGVPTNFTGSSLMSLTSFCAEASYRFC